MQSKINAVLNRKLFIEWLKNQPIDKVYNENEVKHNSLYFYLLEHPEFSSINFEINFADIEIENDITGMDMYIIPNWCVEFQEKMIDYYLDENETDCNVTVGQMLAYFGE